MRPILAVPAVVVPFALVVLAAMARRIAEAAADLRAELHAARGLRSELAMLVDDLNQLSPRRIGPRNLARPGRGRAPH